MYLEVELHYYNLLNMKELYFRQIKAILKQFPNFPQKSLSVTGMHGCSQ